MLELPFLRNNRDEIEQRLSKRNIDAKTLVARALEIDEQRRSTQAELDAKQAELNTLSKAIGDLMKAGQRNEEKPPRARRWRSSPRFKDWRSDWRCWSASSTTTSAPYPTHPARKVPTARHPRRTPW
jgi:seryl-tRNA synthetase